MLMWIIERKDKVNGLEWMEYLCNLVLRGTWDEDSTHVLIPLAGRLEEKTGDSCQ